MFFRSFRFLMQAIMTMQFSIVTIVPKLNSVTERGTGNEFAPGLGKLSLVEFIISLFCPVI